MSGNLVALHPWHVVDFGHFVGVGRVNGDWTHLMFKGAEPAEVDLEKLGLRVELRHGSIRIIGSRNEAPEE